MEEIKPLSVWDLPATRQVASGYDLETIPDSTPENMKIFMDKINELVEEINKLKNK